MTTKKYGKVGLVGRFKPLHNSGKAMLESICQNVDHVVIGIGSSNKDNLRNPFTALESKEMIDAVLSKNYSNYSFVFVPDSGHIPKYKDGKKWTEDVKNLFGELDGFVSGNEYVSELLDGIYKILDTNQFFPVDQWIKSTVVRVEMARGNGYEFLVPEEVTQYLKENNLLDQFREKYGEQTLEKYSGEEYWKLEDSDDEKKHAQED